MTVVADAGPLIALAKVGALPVLFSLFPEILIPPAVYAEAIDVGLQRGEADAVALDQRHRTGELKVFAPSGRFPSHYRGWVRGSGRRFAWRSSTMRTGFWQTTPRLAALLQRCSGLQPRVPE